MVFVTLAVCVAVYTITGVFGFLTFNGKVCISPDVLRNYCAQDPAVDVARVMLIIVMITSYPILAFCGRYIILCGQWGDMAGYPSSIGLLWTTGYSSYCNGCFHIQLENRVGGRGCGWVQRAQCGSFFLSC